MKKKHIVIIFVCMLLLAISISSIAVAFNENEALNIENKDYNNLIKQFIENEVILENNWSEQQQLLASDGGYWDRFGSSVSIDGDYAIIGAIWDENNEEVVTGSAYVFIRSGTTWTEQAKLLASDGEYDDWFGYSVSISGDYAIVGAHYDDNNGIDAGSAYVFTRSGTSWTQQAKLSASDGAADEWFGYSVSIDGEYVIIGAATDDTANGNQSGSAYVFTRSGTTWTQQAKLLASDGAQNDYFGYSVSISGDSAIVGALYDDTGSAYVFTRSGTTWTEQSKLLALDGASGDLFGWSVSIDNDYAIIGAPNDNESALMGGSAYVFTRSGTIWMQQSKLLASDGEFADQFGQSVSIDADYAIIGAPYDDNIGSNSGSAYVFTRSGTAWTQEVKLLASDGAADDNFGGSVSIDGYYAIVGASWDDNVDYNAGSAYVFKKISPDLDCSGTLSWTDVKPGDTVTGSITVENIGDLDSLLDWEIQSYPDWGTWTFDPDSGNDLGEGESIDIDIEVVAPNEEEATFTGEVVLVNTEDSTDNCTIDVSLATPLSHVQPYQQIKRFLQNHPNLFQLLQRLLEL